jgi:hypothetical protein
MGTEGREGAKRALGRGGARAGGGSGGLKSQAAAGRPGRGPAPRRQACRRGWRQSGPPAACAGWPAAPPAPSPAGTTPGGRATRRAAASRSAPCGLFLGGGVAGRGEGVCVRAWVGWRRSGCPPSPPPPSCRPQPWLHAPAASRVGDGHKVGGHLQARQQRGELGGQLVAQPLACRGVGGWR